MIRVIRGYIARRRRKKTRCVVSGFRGAHSRHTQMITQQKMRALAFSHRDRGNKKRDFRRLWITRINAVIHQHMLFHNYSQFIHYLRKNELVINRKILSQIAIFNKSCFFHIADSIYFIEMFGY